MILRCAITGHFGQEFRSAGHFHIFTPILLREHRCHELRDVPGAGLRTETKYSCPPPSHEEKNAPIKPK